MSNKSQSILLGAAVVAVLSTSYLGLINLCCCAGVLIGALAAVWHYTDAHELTIPPGEGAVMGLSAAVVGWFIATIVNFVLMKAGIRADQVIAEFMLEQFRDQMAPAQLEQIEEQLNRPLTLGTYLGDFNLWIGLVVSALFGAIGGAIGAAVFKKGGTTTGTAPDVL